MAATHSNLLFSAIYEINEVDPHGKKFDRVSRIVSSSETTVSELTLDVNTEIFPMSMGESFTLALANSLEPSSGVPLDVNVKAAWKPSLLEKGNGNLGEEFDYIMYGKVYKVDDSGIVAGAAGTGKPGSSSAGSMTGKAVIYASFGGLLMCLSAGDYRSLVGRIVVGQYLYLLIRK